MMSYKILKFEITARDRCHSERPEPYRISNIQVLAFSNSICIKIKYLRNNLMCLFLFL